MNCYITFMLLITLVIPTHGFQTLDDLELCAQKTEEFPKPDNSNWLDLDFSSYHARNGVQNWKIFISRLMQKLGFKKRVPSIAEKLQELLLKLKKKQTNEKSRNTVLLLDPLPNTAIVVWTDLLGAFHSLVRDLRQLHNLNYIDNNLVLSPKCYFIFNGNTLGSSPALLEMLLIITELMYKNPKQVFYLQGSKEKTNLWQDTPLRRELMERASGLTKERLPLESLLTGFFGELPKAMYLTLPGIQPKSFVRISSLGLAFPLLDEKSIFDLITAQNIVTHISSDIENVSESPGLIKAVLRSNLDPIIYQVSNGLTLLVPEKGATTWSSFSSPTQASRELYQFYNDAFVILKTAPIADDWSISLYKQNSLEKKGFDVTTYRLITEQEISREVYTEKIVFGCTLDLNKTVASIGKSLETGLTLAVNKENQHGPFPIFIELVFLNDNYSPQMTNRNVREFLTVYKTPFILSPTGTPTTESLLPLIRHKKILVIFPWTGSSDLRKPDLTHILHITGSYADEARALLEYAITSLKAKTFALFYQNDAYGLSCLTAAKKILKEYGITTWVDVSHARNNLDVKKAAEKITTFNPEVIIFFSLYAPSAALINAIGLDLLSGKSLLGVSPVSDTFKHFLEGKGLKFIISRTFPDPYTSQLPIVKEYRRDMKNAHFEHNFSNYSLEGYISAQVLVELLTRIKGAVTMDAIIKQAEAIKNFNFKGLMLNFNPETRELRNDVWVDASS